MADIRKNNEIDSVLSLRTNATSIRKNDIAAKLAFSRKTIVADIRKNNEIDSTLSLRTNATSIRKNDVATKLAFRRKTNVADIRKSNEIDSTFSLRENAKSIQKNDVAAKLIFSRRTNVINIRKNNEIDLTLITNHAPVSSLLPFPTTALSFHFHCVTGIAFTYNPTLWKNHTTWIKSILPLLQLLMSSFHLK